MSPWRAAVGAYAAAVALLGGAYAVAAIRAWWRGDPPGTASRNLHGRTWDDDK